MDLNLKNWRIFSAGTEKKPAQAKKLLLANFDFEEILKSSPGENYKTVESVAMRRKSFTAFGQD